MAVIRSKSLEEDSTNSHQVCHDCVGKIVPVFTYIMGQKSQNSNKYNNKNGPNPASSCEDFPKTWPWANSALEWTVQFIFQIELKLT